MIASSRLVDITRLPLRGIRRVHESLHIGASTTMEELATDSRTSRFEPLFASRRSYVKRSIMSVAALARVAVAAA